MQRKSSAHYQRVFRQPARAGPGEEGSLDLAGERRGARRHRADAASPGCRSGSFGEGGRHDGSPGMERSLAGRGPERHRAVQQRRGPDRADRGGGSESLCDHARIRRPAGVRRAPGRADHRRGAALAGKRRYRRDRLQRRGPAQPATVPAVEHRPAQPAGRGALLQHVRRVEHDFVAGQRAARNRNPGRQRDPRHGSLRRLPESPA